MAIRAAMKRTASAFIVAAALLGCGGGGGGGGFSGVPMELVPNLRPQPASNLFIQMTDTGAGVQRVLRLASRISNYGEGPMEIVGQIVGADPNFPVPATQVVRWNNGQTTPEPAGEFEFHPEHGHWHWENLVRFRLMNVVNADDPYDPANTEAASTPKVSFCLLDSEKIPGFTGSGQPRRAHYQSCTGNVQGVSAGWTDVYGANLPHQWVVIEGVPDADYWVVLEADPEGILRETDETDNRSAIKINITNNAVTILPWP
jgi:hypothetical protein